MSEPEKDEIIPKPEKEGQDNSQKWKVKTIPKNLIGSVRQIM